MKLPNLSCKRCSHTWIPRSNTKPMVCPKCKSPYWDIPYRIQIATVGTELVHTEPNDDCVRNSD